MLGDKVWEQWFNLIFMGNISYYAWSNEINAWWSIHYISTIL